MQNILARPKQYRFGRTVLAGFVELFTFFAALNESGARYLWLRLALDDSMTVTIPESANRRDITGITVAYTSRWKYRGRGKRGIPDPEAVLKA